METSTCYNPVRSVEAGNHVTTQDEAQAQHLQTAIEAYEKQLLQDALQKNLGHRGNTAAMLGIDRKTLYTKLKKYGMI